MGEIISKVTYDPKTRERTEEHFKLEEPLPASDGSFFVEDSRGVHLMGVSQGVEFTLCGDSFDIGDTEVEAEKLLPTTKRTITCNLCCDAIEHVRGIRISRKNTTDQVQREAMSPESDCSK